jgi:hypothetical protein
MQKLLHTFFNLEDVALIFPENIIYIVLLGETVSLNYLYLNKIELFLRKEEFFLVRGHNYEGSLFLESEFSYYPNNDLQRIN